MPAKKLLETNSRQANCLPDIFEESPILTSHEAGWSKVDLESHCLPPGETPKFILDHPVVAINIGQDFYAEQNVENSWQRRLFFHGAAVICPMHLYHSFCWKKKAQTLALNLEPDLLNQNSTQLFGIDDVELVPQFGIQDGLILQIGLALQKELQSKSMGGRLYAETMANALAVHLLQKYTTLQCEIQVYQGGLSQHKLKLVTNYINDRLERKLGLKELAAVVGFSQYHFSRAFKQSTGLSPHQYVIRQRIERAKQLLRKGRMDIGQVAIACGFTHQSHLHRHFKRLTGITPRALIDL